MKHIQSALCGLALAFCAGSSLADVNVYEIPSSVSLNVIGNQLTHEILNRSIHHWDAYEEQQRAERAAAARKRPAGSAAALMASALPGGEARSAEAAYRQAYRYHEMVIKQFGQPSGDLGVAIASSIAGAWMAYHNKPFPDQFYVPLVRQMQQRVRDGSALRGMPVAERATAYEVLAIAGMMMASSQITWQNNPQAPGAAALAQRMHEQGGAMLTRMLDLPPEQVGIGAQGFFRLDHARASPVAR